MAPFIRRVAISVCVFALGCAPLAFGQDAIGNGDGHSGPFVAPAGFSSINIYTTLAADAVAGDGSVNLTAAGGFAAGDVIMLWRPAGYAPPDPQTQIDLSSSDVGRYQLGRIQSIAGTTIALSAPLQHGFAAGLTQVIRIPEYTDVTIPVTSLLVPGQHWDGHIGGVVAFLATGTVKVDGSISADGAGFRGGAAAFAGACNPQPGEGIGSAEPNSVPFAPVFNGGAADVLLCPPPPPPPGTEPPPPPGYLEALHALLQQLADFGIISQQTFGTIEAIAPANGETFPVGGTHGGPYDGTYTGAFVLPDTLNYSLLDHMEFGGGGGGRYGGSPGGAGGGAVFIRANALEGAGTVSANGQSFTRFAPAAGGGAGGAVYVLLQSHTTMCSGLSANGGTGQQGEGGGGHVLLQTTSATCGTGNGTPSPSVAHGNLAGPESPQLPDGDLELILLPNSQPIVDAGSDQTGAVCAGCLLPVTLQGTASDPDLDPLQITWTENGNFLSAQLTFTGAFGAGVHTLTLSASDGRSAVATKTVVITITSFDMSTIVQQLAAANATINSDAALIQSQAGQITTLQSQLSDANDHVSSLQSQLTDANTQLTTTQSQLNDANATVATQSTTITNLQQEVTSLQAQLDSANSTIGVQTTTIGTLQTELTAANTQLTTTQSQLSDANATIATQSTTITNLQQEVTSLQTQLDSANSTIGAQTTTIGTLQTQVTTLQGQAASLTADNTSLRSQLAGADATITSQATAIAGLQHDLATANQTIAALTQQLTSANLTIGQLAAQLAALQQGLQQALNEPTFVIPGGTVQEKIQNVTVAINNLNPGQKLALYKNLGGTKR